jgi:hypothetical protein
VKSILSLLHIRARDIYAFLVQSARRACTTSSLMSFYSNFNVVSRSVTGNMADDGVVLSESTGDKVSEC